MSAGAATFRSILDKPLNQLTEDDILQLTREDCRKYLKDKGMRRPSWNKSQAIQQVISLKALLEPCDDSGATALRKAIVSPRVNLNQGDSPKEPSDDAQVTFSVDESAHSNVETAKSTPEDPPAEPDNKVTSPRDQCDTNGADDQMTIFYCGKVNVYDGVPSDKASAIMHLAASPIHLPQNHPSGGAAAGRSPPCLLQTANERDDFFPPSATTYRNMHIEKMVEYPQQKHVKGTSTRDSDVEGQTSRKVSLQRYREKRKDRGRLKNKKNTGLSSSSLEGYMNHQMRTHISNKNLGQIVSSSLSPTGVPKDFVGTADNQPKLACFPVDLNVKDIILMIDKNLREEAEHSREMVVCCTVCCVKDLYVGLHLPDMFGDLEVSTISKRLIGLRDDDAMFGISSSPALCIKFLRASYGAFALEIISFFSFMLTRKLDASSRLEARFITAKIQATKQLTGVTRWLKA